MAPMKPMRLLAAIALAVSMASTALPTVAAAGCAVTIPNGSPFPPGGGSFMSADGRPPPTHGNDRLWVGYLAPDGVIVVGREDVKPDGSIELKFPWARRTVEHRTVDGALTGVFAGELEVDARRLDGSAAPALVTTNPSGVHVGSVITFPTTGCWEVIGRAGADTLSFVFFLRIEGQPMPNTATERPDSPLIALGISLLVASLATAVAPVREAASVATQRDPPKA